MRTDARPPTCALTGAAGYLGSALASWMRRQGWVVHELRHRVEARGGSELVRPYALEAGPRPEDLAGIDALVHCAHDFRWTRWSDIERVNVRGGTRLFEAAKAAGVRRLVFVSTLSAFPGCRSYYGGAKLELEAVVTRLGGFVVRPGLIWGGARGGMMGALSVVVARSRIVPLIGAGRQMFYLTHIDDLCRLLEEISRRERVEAGGDPIVAAAETGLAFREILQILARSAGRRVRFVPIPWRPAWLALRAAERLGLRPGFRSDSVLGLVQSAPRPDFGAARAYGVEFRRFHPDALTAACAAS